MVCGHCAPAYKSRDQLLVQALLKSCLVRNQAPSMANLFEAHLTKKSAGIRPTLEAALET